MSGNVTAYGPWEAQVSPDGKRIAYWRGIQRLDAPVGGVTPYDLEDQVVVSRSDRFTPDSTFGYQRSYRDPTWVNNSELLVFNYGLGVEQAAFFAPKPAGDPSFGQWFSDPDVAQIGDGELSRDGHLLAVGAGGGLDATSPSTGSRRTPRRTHPSASAHTTRRTAPPSTRTRPSPRTVKHSRSYRMPPASVPTACTSGASGEAAQAPRAGSRAVRLILIGARASGLHDGRPRRDGRHRRRRDAGPRSRAGTAR